MYFIQFITAVVAVAATPVRALPVIEERATSGMQAFHAHHTQSEQSLIIKKIPQTLQTSSALQNCPPLRILDALARHSM